MSGLLDKCGGQEAVELVAEAMAQHRGLYMGDLPAIGKGNLIARGEWKELQDEARAILAAIAGEPK